MVVTPETASDLRKQERVGSTQTCSTAFAHHRVAHAHPVDKGVDPGPVVGANCPVSAASASPGSWLTHPHRSSAYGGPVGWL